MLPQDKTPTSLAKSFDPRMTWKQQIDKCTARAGLRAALIKIKPVWDILGSRPKRTEKNNMLDEYDRSYGVVHGEQHQNQTVTTSKKVQNQASMTIASALRSTSVHGNSDRPGEVDNAEETLKQSWKLQNSRGLKIIQYRKRTSEPTKCKLKSTNFLCDARRLKRQEIRKMTNWQRKVGDCRKISIK